MDRTVVNPFVGVLAVFLAASSYAEEPYREVEEDVEEVLVTAERSSRNLDDVLGSANVITREDIEASGVVDFADLLRREAGIDVVRSGPVGTLTSVFMRGTESDHVLVLVDGVPFNNGSFGTALWSDLALENIERVEIIRGPRSTMWGSGAIGGVIQIFTRNARELGIEVRGGSFGLQKYTVNAGVGSEYRASFSANKTDAEGFSAQNEEGFSFDEDNDGVNQENVSLNLASRRAGRLNGGLSYAYTHSVAEYDGGSGVNTFRTATTGAYGEYAVPDFATVRASSGYTSQYIDDVFAERRESSLVADLDIHSTTAFLMGVSRTKDHGVQEDAAIDLTGLLPPEGYDETLELKSAFSQASMRFGTIDAVAAIRYDQHSRYEPNVSEGLAVGWWWRDRLKLYVSEGSAYRAPNLLELFRPGDAFGGNPELKPERSRSKEFGLLLRVGERHEFSASVYDTRIQDLIDVPVTGAVNIAKATIEGVELGVNIWFGPFNIKSNATYTKARNQETGEALLRRPLRKGNLALNWSNRHLTFGVDVFSSGKNPDFGTTLDGYSVLNANFQWRTAKQWSLSLRGENLLDKEYSVLEGYNTPPRSGYATVRWKLI